ncbi:metal-dependent transcriptional regulator [Marinoscillum sp.]|uniref:metal-dependent transcriptional regulator n=1 Tax=Marinoscillum sp. TaxID=2024838 RepID=UPI003BAC8FA0
MQLSLTEENYLKAIYHLSETSENGVSTNAIADELSTKAASVSDMIRKLSRKKVIDYQKYRGVQITDLGSKIALQVIRKHRLWEVFLVEKLDFNWDEVHEVAEQLEHIKSSTLISRLDKFLGYPTMDPHGDPIPDENGEIKESPQMALYEFEENRMGIVVKVPDTDPSLLRHLDKIGMRLGSKIKVLEKVEFDNSALITIDQGKEIYLSGEIAKNIMLAIKD